MQTEKWPDIGGRMEGRAHILPIRVYYEDTDFSGRVYHASYMRFCERGRSELLRSAGLSHSDLMNAGDGAGSVFFAVRRMEIEFLGSAAIDDLLEVRSAFTGCSGARLMIDQQVSRGASAILAAEVTVAVLGPDGRPRRIPSRLASTFGMAASRSAGSNKAGKGR